MKVENTTKYETQYLRRLFIACDKHEGAHITNKRMRGRKVWVKPGRGRVGGYAWYHSTSIVMKLPPNANARRVAQVYIHELGHNLGLHHKDMPWSINFDISFWPDEPIPVKTVKIKPKHPVVEIRAEKAQKKLEEWTKKTKRAENLRKKWLKKVRYYEKRAAANINT